MNGTIFNQVKNQLTSEFYSFNDDWLLGCLECVTEQQNGQPTIQEITDFVKGQWLLSDLREINNIKTVLPANLSAQRLVILPGSYMLQVNEMYDIAKSKYKQLQIIRKVDTFNIKVTEDENKQEDNWENSTSGNRMMHLKMTDGVQGIIGMEYTPIPLLNVMLLPGYKVLIKGPVKCRKGVLFLNEANIEGKGGEIDRLLIPNALENLLARAVKKPENPDPYNDQGKANPQKTEQDENHDQEVEALFRDDDFDINFDEIANVENNHGQNNNCNNTRTVEEPTQRVQNRLVSNAQTTGGRESWYSQDLDLLLQAEEDYLEMEERTRDEQNEELYWENSEHEPVGPFITEPDGQNDDTFNEFERMDTQQTTRDDRNQLNACNKKLRSTDLQVTIPSCSSTAQGLGSTNTKTSKQSAIAESNASKERKSEKDGSIRNEVQLTEEAPICDFLCDVLCEEITDTRKRTIRARIAEMAALSKVGSSWIFNCTISDGTGSMDVTFSNKVLEKLVGLTAKEFSRKRKNKDPQVREELTMVLRRAEHTIKLLDAMMEIRLQNGEKPTVIKIIH